MKLTGTGLKRAIALVVVPLVFTLTIVSNSIPALRQDWRWPLERSGFAGYFTESWSGWMLHGLGAPNYHINDYLIALVTVPLGFVLGPYFSFVAFIVGIALLCCWGAMQLSARFGGTTWPQIACAVFAVFNPWVYSEMVAGHSYMVLAYGALMALIAEALRDGPGPVRLSLLAMIVLAQLQFFLIGFLVILITALRTRRWLSLWTATLLALPTIFGVLFNARALSGLPFTLAWQTIQSIMPSKALLLTGYFANYDQTFVRLGSIPLLVMVTMAGVGGITSMQRRHTILVLIVTLFALTVAMGTHGPWATTYQFLVMKTPIVGAFRELYDVLGIALMGYIALSSQAMSRFRFLTLVGVAMVTVLAIAWCMHSPQRFWVNGSGLPRTVPTVLTDTRFALVPAFQPLQYEGTGSGLDPDAVVYPGNMIPINEAVPAWPIDSALAKYEQQGETKDLASLSVGQIAVRPWFRSDASAALGVSALPSRAERTYTTARGIRLSPVPALSWLPLPLVGTLNNRIGSGNVFFGDVAGMRGADIPPAWAQYQHVVDVKVSNEFVHAKDGWVDARLAFRSNPELGQAFGGALTTSKAAVLTVAGNLDTLMYVDGALRAGGGQIIAKSSHGYQWVHLPQNTVQLTCDGTCVVALQGRVPMNLAQNPPARPYDKIDGQFITSWLVAASLKAGVPGTLRLNQRFDPHWIAVARDMRPVHIRLDSSVNGWIVPVRKSPTKIWLLERTAAVQAVFEALAALWCIGFCLTLTVRSLAKASLRSMSF